MRGLPFTLRQLEVFANVCETLSFRRSAENLGISQASVSSQIKALEDQLGISLLERQSGKQPRLSGKGLSFQDDLRSFELAGRALAAHRATEPAVERNVTYRVFIGQGLFDNYVRPKLGDFIAAHPHVQLNFVPQLPNQTAVREVEDGKYDFGLFHFPADIALEPSFRIMARLKGGVFGHVDLARGRKLPLSADDVSALPFMLPPHGTVQERNNLAALKRYGVRPQHVVGTSQYYDVLAAMLERGVAVSTFSDALIAPLVRDRVVLLLPMWDWNAVWFRRDALSDHRRDEVEAFLLSSVLDDPNYPVIQRL